MKAKHLECISDYCGNERTTPGAWADLWERADGTKYITLGGGWPYYGKNTPEVIEENSQHYLPFIQACNDGEDFAYARKHWDK